MERLEILTGSPETSRTAGVICLTGTRLPGGGDPAEVLRAAGIDLTADDHLHREKLGTQTFFWTAGPECPGDGAPVPKELTEAYRTCLSAAAEAGVEAVDLLAVPTGVYDSRLFQTATAVLQAARDWLLTHETAEQVRILCGSDREAMVYKQAYNFWFADTKAARMEDAGWDQKRNEQGEPS